MAERKKARTQPKEQPAEIVPEVASGIEQIDVEAFFKEFDTGVKNQKIEEAKTAQDTAVDEKETSSRFGRLAEGFDTFIVDPGTVLSDAEALLAWLDEDLLKKANIEIPERIEAYKNSISILKALQKGYDERKNKFPDQTELLEKIHSKIILEKKKMAETIIPELKALGKQLYGEAQTEAEKRAQAAYLKSETAEAVCKSFPELKNSFEEAPKTPATTKHEFQKKLISAIIPRHLTTGNHVLNNVEDALRAKEEAEATIKKFEAANNTWDTRLGSAKKDKEQTEAYLRKFRTAQFLAERTSARIQSTIKELSPEDQMRVWENIPMSITTSIYDSSINVIPEIPEEAHRAIVKELIRINLLKQPNDEGYNYQGQADQQSKEKWEKLKIFSELLKGSGKMTKSRFQENIFTVGNFEPKEKSGREIIADIDKLAPDFFTEIVALKNFDPQNRKVADLFEIWKTATGAGTNRDEIIYRQDRRDSDSAEIERNLAFLNKAVSSEKDSTVIYSTKQAVEKLEDLRGRTIEIVAQMEEKIREAKQFEGAELQKAQLEIGKQKEMVVILKETVEALRKANEAKQDEIDRLKISLSESAKPAVKTPETKSGESDAEKLKEVLATIAEIGEKGGTFSGGSMKKAIEALVAKQYRKE